VFIDAFRRVDEEERLVRFHQRFAPHEYLCAIVALELRVGALTAAAAAQLQDVVLAPFERRGRIFAPSYATWKSAAEVAARFPNDRTRAFYNDILIAASCREHGVSLVTRNVADFARIRRVMPFSFEDAEDVLY